VTIAASEFATDSVSYQSPTASALSLANAINAKSGETGVIANVLANVVTFTINTAELSSDGYLLINGVTVIAGATVTTNASAIISAINDYASQTGVAATAGSNSTTVVLTATDGRNILIAGTAGYSASNVLGLGFTGSTSNARVYRGKIRLSSDEAIVLSGGSGVYTAGTTSTSSSFTLNTVSLSTRDNAETAIFILDNVIRQLQSRRADVGSKVIRMELLQSELASRKENVNAAESLIRDADVASETAQLTSLQILQQAGASVLQRANALPQIALSLLQG
jgi:flagellin